MTKMSNSKTGNKMSDLPGNEQTKRFLLIVRRALLMIVRGIEEMYPEDFKR